MIDNVKVDVPGDVPACLGMIMVCCASSCEYKSVENYICCFTLSLFRFVEVFNDYGG